MAIIVLILVDNFGCYGVVFVDDNGWVLSFLEKLLVGKVFTNFVNVGTYVFEFFVFDRIFVGYFILVEREIFLVMVIDGILFVMVSDSYWVDVGIFVSYLVANFYLVDYLVGGIYLEVRVDLMVRV